MLSHVRVQLLEVCNSRGLPVQLNDRAGICVNGICARGTTARLAILLPLFANIAVAPLLREERDLSLNLIRLGGTHALFPPKSSVIWRVVCVCVCAFQRGAASGNFGGLAVQSERAVGGAANRVERGESHRVGESSRRIARAAQWRQVFGAAFVRARSLAAASRQQKEQHSQR